MKRLHRVHRRNWLAGLALLPLAVLAAPPDERGQGRGQGAGKGGGKPDKGQDGAPRAAQGDGGALIAVSFSQQQARALALQGGFTGAQGGYKPLPPGIRKNLARGKRLPPGIAKQQAPAGMLRELPHYPGYEWQVCGTDLVLVALGTLLIAAVLTSVFD